MKKVFFAFALVASCSLLNAQESGPTLGIKAGLNFGNLKAKGDGETESGDIRSSFHVGISANVPLSESLSFNPELYYSDEGSKDEGKESLAGVGEVSYKQTSKLGYLNLPLLLQYNTNSGFFVHTGPQIGLLLSAKEKYKLEFDGEEESEENDVKDDCNSTSFSWTFGMGYKTISGLGIAARYNLGLSNIVKDAADGYSLKSNVIQVGLTYTLGRK